MAKQDWEKRAACAPQNLPDGVDELDWFSTDKDEKYRARAVCQGLCPVRKECIAAALNRKELHGIWGGVDDYEIRRAMSVTCLGSPTERDRPPRCPYCLCRKIDVSGQKTKSGYLTQCLNTAVDEFGFPLCGLTWYMAVIPTRLRKKAAA